MKSPAPSEYGNEKIDTDTIIVFIRIMFRINVLAIFSLMGLIILNFYKARSAKIKELDLALLRVSDSFNFYASLRQERLQNYQNGSFEYR
jgi:hypothetical protein